MSSANENKVANEAIDFLVGDILVDTKYDYGGHVMVVSHVDPLKDRVMITHPDFTFPAIKRWNKYSAFENKAPREGTAKYILRWIGPSYAVHRNGEYMSIRKKVSEVVNYLRHLSRRGDDLSYSKIKGACMYYLSHKCFDSNRKISDKSLEDIQQSERFVCSSYGTFVWKYVLEQFEIPEELRAQAPTGARTLDDIAFPIDPYECLPSDVKEIADRFPQFWEKIPYYTKKIEFVEMNELTNKRLPVAAVPAASTASASNSSPSQPFMNISSIPYSFGGKRTSRRHRRRQTKRRKQRRVTRK